MHTDKSSKLGLAQDNNERRVLVPQHNSESKRLNRCFIFFVLTGGGV